jgi:hypothetical protein
MPAVAPDTPGAADRDGRKGSLGGPASGSSSFSLVSIRDGEAMLGPVECLSQGTRFLHGRSRQGPELPFACLVAGRAWTSACPSAENGPGER